MLGGFLGGLANLGTAYRGYLGAENLYNRNQLQQQQLQDLLTNQMTAQEYVQAARQGLLSLGQQPTTQPGTATPGTAPTPGPLQPLTAAPVTPVQAQALPPLLPQGPSTPLDTSIPNLAGLGGGTTPSVGMGGGTSSPYGPGQPMTGMAQTGTGLPLGGLASGLPPPRAPLEGFGNTASLGLPQSLPLAQYPGTQASGMPGPPAGANVLMGLSTLGAPTLDGFGVGGRAPPQAAAGAAPDLGGQLNLLPQYNALGTTRPFGPGEYVMNSDGSWSSEYTKTVEDPRRAGRYMVVPTLWLKNGKPTIFSEDQAADAAVSSGLNFPTFGSLPEAEEYANRREAIWQQTPVGRSDVQPALWSQPTAGPTPGTAGMPPGTPPEYAAGPYRGDVAQGKAPFPALPFRTGYDPGSQRFLARVGGGQLRPDESVLPQLVAQMESSGGTDTASQPADIVDPVYGQKREFIQQYGSGPEGVNNLAQAVLRANPNATVSDYYANYVLGGTGQTATSLATRDPAAYRNMQGKLRAAGVSENTPLRSLAGGGAFPAVHAEMSSNLSPEQHRIGTRGAQILMTMPQIPQAMQMADPRQIAQLLDRQLPGTSDAVKGAILIKLMPLMNEQAKEQMAQAWKDFDAQMKQLEFREKVRHEYATEGRIPGARVFDTPQGPQWIAPGQPIPPGSKLQSTAPGPDTPSRQGYQILTDTNGQQYQMIPGRPDTAIDMQGNPYKPSGAARIGTVGPGQARWSEDAMNSLVQQALAGDPSVMQRLPRSGPARQQFEETLAAHMNNLPGGIEGNTSTMMMNRIRMLEAQTAARTAGRVTMNTELYSQEAQLAGKNLIEVSKEVPRSAYKPINELLLAFETNTGDPNVIKLGTAVNAVINAYGKMSNPTGTGIHDTDKARISAILDRSLSQGQIEAGVSQIITEGRLVSQAAQKAQEEVLGRITPRAPGTQPRSDTGAAGGGATSTPGREAGGTAAMEGDTMTYKGKTYHVGDTETDNRGHVMRWNGGSTDNWEDLGPISRPAPPVR